MAIIDIHAHLPWDGTTQTWNLNRLLSDTSRHGIARRVISSLEGPSIAAANDAVAQAAADHPDRLIGCAVINPKDFGAVAEARRMAANSEIAMFEFNSVEHGYYPDVLPRLRDVLDVASESAIPVKAFTGIGSRSMPQQWAHVGKQYPDIPFILLHTGCFDYGYGCVDLATQPNIYLETSNQFEVQVLRKLFTIADPHKILFGSGFPELFTRCSLEVFDPFGLSAEVHTQILGGNAANLLHLAKGNP